MRDRFVMRVREHFPEPERVLLGDRQLDLDFL
jgi:hypothetical protein